MKNISSYTNQVIFQTIAVSYGGTENNCSTYTKSNQNNLSGRVDIAGFYSINPYRFGFNGKEKDDEWKTNGNSYDYGFRIYDPRLGRFLSVDPLFKTYAFFTPYQFASNKPIVNIDIDGLEGEKTNDEAYVLRQAEGLKSVYQAEIKSLSNQLGNAQNKLSQKQAELKALENRPDVVAMKTDYQYELNNNANLNVKLFSDFTIKKTALEKDVKEAKNETVKLFNAVNDVQIKLENVRNLVSIYTNEQAGGGTASGTEGDFGGNTNPQISREIATGDLEPNSDYKDIKSGDVFIVPDAYGGGFLYRKDTNAEKGAIELKINGREKATALEVQTFPVVKAAESFKPKESKPIKK